MLIVNALFIALFICRSFLVGEVDSSRGILPRCFPMNFAKLLRTPFL